MRFSPLLAVFFGLAACGQGEPDASASSGVPGATITKETATTRTVESNDGVIKGVGTKGSTAARFPNFAPPYPGARVQSSIDMKVGPQQQHIIVQMTADAPEKPLAFYEGTAKSAGLATKRIASPSGEILVIGTQTLGGLSDNMITVQATPAGSTISMMQIGK